MKSFRNRLGNMLEIFFTSLMLITVYSTPNAGQQLPKDPECECEWRYLKHYEAKGCVPIYAEKSSNGKSNCTCPLRFDCPQAACEYKKQFYKIGSHIPTSDRCLTCFCRIDYYTQDPYIVCNRGECFNFYSFAPTSKECHTVYQPNKCCPTVECLGEGQENTSKVPICKHNGRMYYEGEIIYTDEDPCRECLCNSNWTGINGASCSQYDCMLETDSREFKRGCIPIYHEKTCCPIEYHCPDRLKVLRKPNIKSEDNKDMCYFEGLFYAIGDVLDIKHPTHCVNCTCKIPPDFTCIHRSCPPHPTGDYENCRPIDKPNVCCPDYSCIPEKVYSTPNTGQQIPEDTECECEWRYLKHYEAKGCVPVYAERSINGKSNCTCPLRFDCSQANKVNVDNEACVYKKQFYKIGSKIPTSDRCRRCFCRKDYLTEDPYIECRRGECFTIYPKSKECHKVYQANSCCPTVECLGDEQGNTSKVPICKHNGTMYYEGERIYTDEDPCRRCLCNSNWTGINGASCSQYDCMLETRSREFKKGCIPIYHEKTCCPIDYHCPNRHEIIREPRIQSEDNEDEMCYFDGLFYAIGYVLDIKHPTHCVNCTCKIPPDFTCIYSSCPPHPTGDYENCRPIKKPNVCCPDYPCVPKTR